MNCTLIKAPAHRTRSIATIRYFFDGIKGITECDHYSLVNSNKNVSPYRRMEDYRILGIDPVLWDKSQEFCNY